MRPGLFIGSMAAARDKALLRKHRITHVLTMNGVPPVFPKDFTYEVKKTNDADRRLLLQYLPTNLQFISGALTTGGMTPATSLVGYVVSMHIVVPRQQGAFNVIGGHMESSDEHVDNL